jgi:DNA-binding transcriptional LysR family regulator
LRISVSEGFGSKFLTRYVKDFGAVHPALTLDLVANSGFLSPSKREADIAVMLSRPKAGPVLSRKLADYKLKLYASTEYLQAVGAPASLRDLRKDHTLVGYVPDLVYAPELNYLGEFESGLAARIRSSSINAQLELLIAGVGIGVLPCFIGDLATDLIAILPEHSIIRSFWLVTHRDTQNLMRVKAGKEWLLHCVREGKAHLFPEG